MSMSMHALVYILVYNLVQLVDVDADARHPAQDLVGRWTAPPLLDPLPSFSDGAFAGN